MSLLRRGGTRRAALVTAVSLGMFQALVIVGAMPAGALLAATDCNYNAATDTVTIQMEANEDLTLGVVDATPGGSADEIRVTASTGTTLAPIDCGSATVSNTVLVVVLGSGATAGDETLSIDNADTGGSFGSIGFSIDMGNNTVVGDTFIWIGTDAADTVTVTNNTFVANGGNGELVGVEAQMFNLLDGDDVFDASGSSTGLGVVDDTVTPTVCTTPGVLGGLGDDTITGGSGDDYLDGEAGDDTVSGGDGGDCVFGSGDDDTLAGDAGQDNVDGGLGDDFVDEGSAPNGNDLLEDGGGTDTLNFGARTGCVVIDEVNNESGEDTDCDGVLETGEEINDSNGFEILISGSNNDVLAGNGSDETFMAGTGVNSIDGGGGSDTMSFADVAGPIAVDSLAGTGVDTNVSDTFTDIDTLDGSPSLEDVLDFSGETGPIGANLCTGVVTGSSSFVAVTVDTPGVVETCTSTFERLIGSPGNDILTGDINRNRLDGGDGSDALSGGGGNDRLIGGAGNDTFTGGPGADRVNFNDSPNGVNVDLSLGFATGNGDDSFGDTIEIVVGSQFNDHLTGGPFGTGGTVNFLLVGRRGNDVLTGFNGNDTLKGGGGEDLLRGVGGADTLQGANGKDRLFGGGGNDLGRGGRGKDVCRGVEITRSCGTPRHPNAPQVARLV